MVVHFSFRKNLLRAWRTESRNQNNRPSAHNRPQNRNPPRRPILRPDVVRPVRHLRLGDKRARSRVGLRLEGNQGLLPHKRARTDRKGTPAGAIRLHPLVQGMGYLR